jgi:hypothetical protein
MLFLLVLVLESCVSLHSISINSQPDGQERSNPINAEVSKLIFLGLNFNNDFLDEVPKKLMDSCPGGKIKGIVTRYETVSYVFFYRFVVKAKGFCTK